MVRGKTRVIARVLQGRGQGLPPFHLARQPLLHLLLWLRKQVHSLLNNSSQAQIMHCLDSRQRESYLLGYRYLRSHLKLCGVLRLQFPLGLHLHQFQSLVNKGLPNYRLHRWIEMGMTEASNLQLQPGEGRIRHLCDHKIFRFHNQINRRRMHHRFCVDSSYWQEPYP